MIREGLARHRAVRPGAFPGRADTHRRARLAAGCAALAMLGACTTIAPRPTATVALPVGPVPIGTAGLAEARSTRQLVPGLTHHQMRRGVRRGDQHWVVSSQVARTPAERAQAHACLARIGLSAVAADYRAPGSQPLPYQIFQGGAFASEAAARAALPDEPDAACPLSVQHSSGDPSVANGPWSIHIIEVDPRHYRGRILSALGQGTTAGLETTSSLARRHGATAAINGGFFVMTAADGVVGEPAGISAIGGQLRSEPTTGRPFVVLRDRRPVSVEIIDAAPALPIVVRWSDGRRSVVNGIDRKPGVIRNCGISGSRPTERPMHDVTCSSAGELVALTEGAGAVDIDGTARALRIRRDGTVAPASRMMRAGAGETILVASGARGAELEGRARARIDLSLCSLLRCRRSGDAVHWSAVNGGPLLIRRGAAVRREDAEGWLLSSQTDPARATMVHNWVNRRNPRSALGIAADGRIFVVTVDGREFEGEGRAGVAGSVGMTIEEMRVLMAWLGAVDAINLDGGGSTTVVVGGQVVNRPSDKTGERPVGDAILFAPRGADAR